jgi:hypothetical protein
LDTRYGGFTIALFEQFSTVNGTVANGVVPITIHAEVGSSANCELLRRDTLFCNPACNYDETCDLDGTCIPFPENQNLGTVTIGGLEKELILTPVDPGANYFDTSLPHPAFQPGSLIEIRTHNGQVFDDIEMHGIGVEPLVVDNDSWVLARDTDLSFTWTPPTDSNARSVIHTRLNIDQHGNTPVQLFCEFSDSDGTAALPADLINQLMDFGVTGFPNATITRRTVDSTAMISADYPEGCVEFIVKSQFEPSISIQGFIPCNTDADCEAYGLTCTPPPVGLCE